MAKCYFSYHNYTKEISITSLSRLSLRYHPVKMYHSSIANFPTAEESNFELNCRKKLSGYLSLAFCEASVGERIEAILKHYWVVNQSNAIDAVTSGFCIRCDTTRNNKSPLIGSPAISQEQDTGHAQTVSALFDYIRGLTNTHASISSFAFLLTKELIICRVVVWGKKCRYTIQRNGGEFQLGDNVTGIEDISLLKAAFKVSFKTILSNVYILLFLNAKGRNCFIFLTDHLLAK